MALGSHYLIVFDVVCMGLNSDKGYYYGDAYFKMPWHTPEEADI